MERRQGWLVVGLAGELDHATTGLLDAELSSAVAGVLGASVALELAHLTFASLAGLGLLVAWWRRMTRGGGRLVLLNPTGQVRSALTVTGIDQVITIHHTAGRTRKCHRPPLPPPPGPVA
ncbi:STAS domain-containing protein [Actinomadura namibiensis]|uniref:Anti-sigma factor antagonist n=1 Tax=Actinomadura namibiensis TaxID=182080 RepID=A0A7W3LIQ4_ACTNM|nr:STAS domain-containing protein [Actinomadura namibiensis]MBA8948830.1 anti-anti-sigma factor [Actinomadura namibiensis]